MDGVKTIVIKGKTLRGGNEVPYATFIQFPDKFRNESEMMGNRVVQVINGDKGWMVNPRSDEVQEVTGPRLDQMRSRMNIGTALMSYDKAKDKISLVGTEELEGTPVYKIKLIKADGREVISLIDRESHVVLQETVIRSFQGQDIEATTMYGNHKTVDGILVAFSTETRMSGNQPQGTGRGRGMGGASQMIESVEFNKTIDQKLFGKPVK